MPSSRKSKTASRAKPYDNDGTSDRFKKSFGPISDQDPNIAAFKGVGAARKFNNSRIELLLKTLVPCPPKQDWIKSTETMGVSKPKFSSGKKDDEHLGEWYQVCFKPDVTVSQYITPTLEPDVISRAGDLPLWLAIREEIKAKPRFQPTLPKAYSSLRGSPSTPQLMLPAQVKHPYAKPPTASTSSSLLPLPTPFPILSHLLTSFRIASPAADHEFRQGGLDLDVPVLLIAWVKDGEAPLEFIGYPRLEDGGFRLGDFKLALGSLGLETSSAMEIYFQDTGAWLGLLWSTSIRVCETHRVFFVRDTSINSLSMFDELCERYYAPAIGKGKQRA